ncbi:MAG: type II secretion system F family protein [Methanobrevibacter sp.]|nr:type II secretion system F family protein [Methanobrevibacter sp.]
MLNNLFIAVGNIALSFFIFLKSIRFRNTEVKNEKETGSILLKRLNIDLETQSARYESDRICEIRIVLLNYMLNKRIIVALMAFIAISIFFCSIEFVGIILTVIIMFYVFILYYPQIKEQQNYSDINQELPYALRHMGIELKAGKGLHDSMITIRDAEYGSLSREFNRALEEIKFGKSTEDALLDMSHRIKSQGLSIAIQQIISTLRVGGNLSNSLNIIAKDITFDMNIKLKEYSQKLNSFILIYTFIAILAPTIALVMLMAGSTVIGDVISSNLLLTIYTLFFPIIIIFMGVFIKKLEPKI